MPAGMQAFSALVSRKRIGTVLQRVLNARIPIVKIQDAATGASASLLLEVGNTKFRARCVAVQAVPDTSAFLGACFEPQCTGRGQRGTAQTAVQWAGGAPGGTPMWLTACMLALCTQPAAATMRLVSHMDVHPGASAACCTEASMDVHHRILTEL